MEFGATIISFMFFLAFCIYLYWGIHIILINKTEQENKMFLGICIAMSIWAFSFAMSNSASDIKSAIFWRRISAIGWTSVYSLMLHFLILISNKKLNSKQTKLLGILHLPVIINMYIFSFSNKLAITQHNLIKTDLGWTSRSIGNGLDMFFRLYYISYILMSILVVWIWQRRIEDRQTAKRAKLIAYSLFASGALGTITDIVMTSLLNKPMPQLGPIFILLPAGSMYYAVRYFDIFKAKISKKEEIILTSEEEENIFKNISLGFYTASLLTFLSEYIPYIDEENAFKVALLKALIICSIGIIIRLIQNIKKENIKRNLTTIALILSVPICLFMFIKYASVTVWAFTMILILAATIFSKRILLVSITIVSIITQILIWIVHPEITLVVDKYDYILRIGMLVVAFFIGLSTNKMYVSKIKDNKNKIEFQKIVSDILFDFLDINQDNFDCKVNNLLEEVGNFFHVDRTYLFTINPDNDTMTYSNEWCNRGINKEVGTIEEIPLDVFPWWIEELETKKMVTIEDVDEMPKEAREEQEQLHRQEVKSLVSVPVMVNDKIKAFIGIDSVLENKPWSTENIEMLNIMANILSSGFMQIKADKEIEYMAYYDNLTGIPNRFLFKDRVENAISLAEQNEKFISIMFIDLDNFKSVNDTMGHDGGDYLLKEVSNGLSKRIRKTDTVARFGGDEFIILLNNIDNHNDISKIADNIMRVFSKPFIINGQEVFITASGGIATYPIDGEDSESLVKNADTAMYEAKDNGKNQYSLCTHDMKDEVEKNMKLSNGLYRALERNELSIHYQPQIDLNSKEITGLEALLRWKHPEYGMISPVVFIPLAEKNGSINSIGEWVLRTACNQNKAWQDMGLLYARIAVNLSVIQFNDPLIVEKVDKILKETGLSPKHLELEITESIAVKENKNVVDILDRLKKLGVSISIDDFGTEYSSLSRLKTLPIDRLKIDMQFIRGIEDNEKDQAIAKIIINLANSLNLEVIAEGVETKGQMEFLNQKMCDEAQGYYYYKPMPAEELEEILINKIIKL
ncbi:EAL domain-containing protein [Lachnospiraceae bacterium LCP25S3_G4]